jgi:hydrogenase maturation protease
MSAKRVLVLGIGNVLMGDEGVGAYAAHLLATERWPDGVTVLDGGTGGFHLLEPIGSHDLVVLIDAAMDGRPTGTVSLLRPRYASDFPRALTAHDIGLRDLIEGATLVAKLPPIMLLTVSIESIQAMSTVLSRPVRDALPRLLEAVREIVAGEGARCHA